MRSTLALTRHIKGALPLYKGECTCYLGHWLTLIFGHKPSASPVRVVRYPIHLGKIQSHSAECVLLLARCEVIAAGQNGVLYSE